MKASNCAAMLLFIGWCMLITHSQAYREDRYLVGGLIFALGGLALLLAGLCDRQKQ